MTPELTLVDQISLGSALLFVFVFITNKIWTLIYATGSCGGCSQNVLGGCASSTPNGPSIVSDSANQAVGIIATDRSR